MMVDIYFHSDMVPMIPEVAPEGLHRVTLTMLEHLEGQGTSIHAVHVVVGAEAVMAAGVERGDQFCWPVLVRGSLQVQVVTWK